MPSTRWTTGSLPVVQPDSLVHLTRDLQIARKTNSPFARHDFNAWPTKDMIDVQVYMYPRYV